MSSHSLQFTDVAIIGSGFSGLCVGIQLKKSSQNDFLILEKSQNVGGTWRDNSYPGAACDIPSHLYSFSFEPNPDWTRVYPVQAEIESYMNHCADKYALRSHLLFGTEVKSITYQDITNRWLITSDSGAQINARVVVSGTGGLSRPSIPKISGLESFAGKVFHSSRWDHEYDLRGKNVAVIGTGASAIQFVPEVIPLASQLTLFQRTPAWVVPKRDGAYSPEQRSRFKRFPFLQHINRTLIYWQHEFRALFFTQFPSLLKRLEPKVRSYINYQLKSPELQKKMTPNYTFGCKRILLSNNFYKSLNEPNALVITKSITEITPTGIKTQDGITHPADTIIFGTGFLVADAGLPFPVKGIKGLDLGNIWTKGSSAYLGCTVPEFPNLFLMTGPNTGLAHNSMIVMIEAQTKYIMSALKQMKKHNVKSYNLRPESLISYNQTINHRMAKTVWSIGGCKSWYISSNGRNETLWPGFTFEFILKSKNFNPNLYDPIYA